VTGLKRNNAEGDMMGRGGRGGEPKKREGGSEMEE